MLKDNEIILKTFEQDQDAVQLKKLAYNGLMLPLLIMFQAYLD